MILINYIWKKNTLPQKIQNRPIVDKQCYQLSFEMMSFHCLSFENLLSNVNIYSLPLVFEDATEDGHNVTEIRI